MNIPKELIDQWLTEGIDSDMVAHEYIAYRAAAWALSQPVSMEPVDEVRIHDGHEYVMVKPESDYYTAAQLAQARQQGAEDQTDKTLEAVRVASERIAELEQKNAVLLEALKLIEEVSDRAAVAIARSAIAAAEVKP